MNESKLKVIKHTFGGIEWYVPNAKEIRNKCEIVLNLIDNSKIYQLKEAISHLSSEIDSFELLTRPLTDEELKDFENQQD